MATVAAILKSLEQIAPSRYAFAFDKVGLQVGDPASTVSRAVVSLDRSLGAVAFAVGSGAELVLAHHPLLFEPLSSVTSLTHVGRTVRELVKHDISFIAAHTNWDSARGGVNDALALLLGIGEVVDFGGAADVAQFKMTVFVPKGDLDRVIDAASLAGAGEIGLYSRCAFFAAGTGTYLGGEGSNPTIGMAGKVERTEELRLEMVLPAGRWTSVESAVRQAHSYEEPAIDFYPLTPCAEQPAGRVGSIAPVSLSQFKGHVQDKLRSEVWAWGDPDRQISRVAVVGGAADGEWRAAQAAGADLFVTGEVRQHIALEAVESGLAIMAAGHYATEQPGVVALRDRLAVDVPDVEWILYEPAPGQSGRPLEG